MIYYVHYFAQIRIVLNNSKIKKKTSEISSVFLLHPQLTLRRECVFVRAHGWLNDCRMATVREQRVAR